MSSDKAHTKIMPVINVAKSFSLTLAGGISIPFSPGAHDVSDEIANNWFTKTNLVGYVPPTDAKTWESEQAERLKANQEAAESAKKAAELEREQKLAKAQQARLEDPQLAAMRETMARDAKLALDATIAHEKARKEAEHQAQIRSKAEQEVQAARYHVNVARAAVTTAQAMPVRAGQALAAAKTRLEDARSAVATLVTRWLHPVPGLEPPPSEAAILAAMESAHRAELLVAFHQAVDAEARRAPKLEDKQAELDKLQADLAEAQARLDEIRGS